MRSRVEHHTSCIIFGQEEGTDSWSPLWGSLILDVLLSHRKRGDWVSDNVAKLIISLKSWTWVRTSLVF